VSCQEFRKECAAGDLSSEGLVHLRACEDCLGHAIDIDADLAFRAIGGEMEPLGGVETFVADVMHQIHVHETEKQLRAGSPWGRRVQGWAVAAAATVAVIAGAIAYPRFQQVPAEVQQTAAVVRPATPVALVSRPIIESYSSANATIVEVPTEAQDDIKVVMVFDDKLPADL
jgi:hypothetical protein